MKLLLPALLMASLLGGQLCAQDIRIPVNLDRLAQRATESVDVTLDASLLQLASGFLSKDDPDQIKVKRLVSKLKGVYVRSFEFDKEGQYSMADVEAIRAQLKAPVWSRIVGVKSIKGENSEIYLKKDGEQIGGLVVLDAEPKELTIVHIDGPINPEELSELSGHMGIPKLGSGKDKASDKEKKDAKKDEDESRNDDQNR
ncbi:MAG TPA: DUF4252 domain-containing protein [Bryobacteraceae bacterium]|nr:DUF4252 domain-containing protein [Bryobacteraceae bacterium]